MTAPQALIAAGLALASIIGYVVFAVIAETAADEVKGAVFRRPSLAVRRTRYRGLLGTGYLLVVLAAACAFFALAIATNGRTDNAADTRTFLIATVVLATAATLLLTTWWRKAGGSQ